MRTLLCCLILAVVNITALPGDDTGSLKVPELLAIASAGQGFEWKHVTDAVLNGVKARYYLCSSGTSESRVLLMVEERFPETDKHKIAALKAHLNAQASKMVEEGYKLTYDAPKPEPPIPSRVSFAMTGKKKDGERHVRVVTIFGKNIYSITVWADNAKEADRLAEVAKSFKELAK
jgi:hypothetical protein